MDASLQTKVFLSYARTDAEVFATALRDRLSSEQPQLDVWLDRAEMAAGNWWKQITDTLSRSQFLVLIMTPGAVQSVVARKEWQYAREQGLVICPVRSASIPQASFDTLPSWMSKVHCYDLDREWNAFVNQLRHPDRRSRVPFMAPDLREGFVERTAEFGDILNCFVETPSGEPIRTTVVLHGGGGFGKSTLAISLCHDDRILNAFGDGILWVTLGPKPNLEEALTKLYASLTGTRPGFVDEEDAAIHLSKELQDKTALIVLDDVWDSSHLRPFERGGPGCARLITTRIFDVTMARQTQFVRAMSMTEAVQMLNTGLKGKPEQAPVFERLGKRLGAWPILLKLANGTIRQRVARGDSVIAALDFLNRALDKRGIVALDHHSAIERDQAISKTIEVSLDLLDSAERLRYMELSIFPEGLRVPIDVISMLWEMDEVDTEMLIERIDKLSLLEFNLQDRTVSLHDVMRTYLAPQLRNGAELHERLVHRFGDPFSLTDSYAWRWLTYHLAAAGRHNDLKHLLLDFRWLERKLEETDISSLIRDYDWLRSDPAIQLVQGALRLGAHIIASDPVQLAGQLLGRLGLSSSPEMRSLLQQAADWKCAPWFRPIRPSLVVPGGALLRTLVDRGDEITALAMTPSGHRAVTASSGGRLKFWNLEDGHLECTLEGHSERVVSVGLSDDGRVAISGSLDRKVVVWDMERGAQTNVLEGHDYGIVAVVMTGSGRTAISASLDETIKVWDLRSGQEIRTLKASAVGICNIAVSADGRRLIAALLDNTIRVWSLEEYDEICTLSGHTAVISGITITGDGRRAVSSSFDGALKVWDLESRTEKQTFRGSGSGVLAIATTPDGRRAVSGSLDEIVQVWDLEAGVERRILRGHNSGVNAVAITSDGQRAISASLDGTLKLWELEKDEHGVPRREHTAAVTGLSATRSLAVSSSHDRTIRVWDIATGDEVRTLAGHQGVILGISLTADGRHAASACMDNTVRIWDVGIGGLEHTIDLPDGGALAVAITPDGRRVIAASLDQSILVWSTETGQRQAVLQGHTEAVVALAVTEDGRRAVSGSLDETVRVWDLDSGEVKTVFKGHGGGTLSVAVHPEGNYAAAGTWDGTITIWDLSAGRHYSVLLGHKAGVRSVNFSAELPHLISASEDHTIKLWNIPEKRCLATFTADGPILACTLAADGHTVIAGEPSGRLHFLDLTGLPPVPQF
jgi:WD40 repeat protein